ncbi:MAG: phosphoribosylpyrophosphate synthetase [Ignavibacteria bacterium]|nr:phosphoribosylpyrophosphate synthetase [Ignavibacteria bacterium]
MKTISEITECLREEGYIHDFSIKEDAIHCEDCGETVYYKPDELIIEKTERYEGESDPSDNAIVYAITAHDGNKGVLIDSYGTYSDPKLAKVIGGIPLREQHNLQV